MTAAMEPENSVPAVVDSVGGSSGLSILQRNFAREFVANGGKATEAAIAAGYAAPSARISATKCLCNPRVGHEIERLSRTFIYSGLPAAIHRLFGIIMNPETKDRDALKAVNSLLERAGMAAPKGGLQVNVGVQVNGQQAQALIGEVWQAKQARLSDIPPAMSDTNLRQIEQSIDVLASLPADPPGGDQLQGPAGPQCPLPVPQPTELPNSDDLPPAPTEAFRKAFDDDEA